MDDAGSPAAPRLGPHEHITVTRVGRFRRHDPRRPGLIWGRWRWAGLLLWALIVGGATARALRLRGAPDTGPARPVGGSDRRR